MLVSVAVILVIIVDGLVCGFLGSNASAVNLSGTVYVDANISMSQLMGESCYPYTWTVEAVVPVDFYNKLLSFANQESPLINSNINLCLAAVDLCELSQAAGGNCDLSTIYVTDPTAIPDGVSIVGYVLGVNVTLNNRLPVQIASVNATSNDVQLPVNFEKTSCSTNCRLSANVTLGPMSEPTKINLAIRIETPLNWFMWGNFGMIQKTIVTSLEFTPSTMTVQAS